MSITLFLIFFIQGSVIWSANLPNSIKLTGLQCFPNDEWFRNTNCSLKVLSNRSILAYAYSYLYRPVTAPMVHVKVERWMNGFRPFLFDFWAEGCKIFVNGQTQNRIVKVFVALITENTNLNHTCPFYGDLMFRRVDLPLTMVPSLLVSGTYRLELTFTEKTKENVVFTCKIKGIISSELTN